MFTAIGSTLLCLGNMLYSYCSKFVSSYIGVSVSQLYLVPTTLLFSIMYDKTFSAFHYVAFLGILVSVLLVSYTKKTTTEEKYDNVANGVLQIVTLGEDENCDR